MEPKHKYYGLWGLSFMLISLGVSGVSIGFFGSAEFGAISGVCVAVTTEYSRKMDPEDTLTGIVRGFIGE